MADIDLSAITDAFAAHSLRVMDGPCSDLLESLARAIATNLSDRNAGFSRANFLKHCGIDGFPPRFPLAYRFRDLRTPEQWLLTDEFKGLRILDPDGWRGRNGRDWEDKISHDEFQSRLARCTVEHPRES